MAKSVEAGETRQTARLPVAWLTNVNLGRGLLFVALAFLPVLFATNTLEEFEFPKTLGLRSVGLCLLAPGLLLVGSWRQFPSWCRGLFKTDLLTAGVVLLFVSALLSTLFSVNPRISWWGEYSSYAGLATIAAYVILYFAARRLAGDTATMERLASACVLGGLIAATYAILQMAGVDAVGWKFSADAGSFVRPCGTMGHANHLGAYLTMVLPLVPCLAIATPLPLRRKFGIALVGVILLAGMTIAMCRAAWIGLAAALLMWLVANSGAVLRRRLKPILGIAAALLALMTLVVVWNPGGVDSGIQDRLVNRASATTRFHMWSGAMAIWSDHPVFGCGPDLFQMSVAATRSAAFWDLEWNTSPTRAHNEVLHLLATQGIVGVLALLVFVAGLVQAARRALRQDDARTRHLAMALVCGIVVYAAVAFLSFTTAGFGPAFVVFAALLNRLAAQPAIESSATPSGQTWFRPALIVAAVSIFAMFAWNLSLGFESMPGSFWPALLILGGSTACFTAFPPLPPAPVAPPTLVPQALHRSLAGGVGSRTRQPGARAWLVLGACSIGMVFLVVLPWLANVACARGEARLAAGKQEALADFEQAVTLDPAADIHWTKLAAALQACAGKTRDGERRREYLGRAADIWERLTNVTPTNASHHANRGICLSMLCKHNLAKPGDVFAAFETAHQLDPTNPIFFGDAADAALRLGQTERARAYATAGLERHRHWGPLHGQLGYLDVERGQWRAAIAHLETGLYQYWADHDDWREAALANLVVAYHRNGDYGLVPGAAEFFLRTHPDAADIRALLAFALEKRGRLHEAYDHYQRVLSQAPNHPTARGGLDRLRAGEHVVPASWQPTSK